MELKKKRTASPISRSNKVQTQQKALALENAISYTVKKKRAASPIPHPNQVQT